jgi:hypothetical protein
MRHVLSPFDPSRVRFFFCSLLVAACSIVVLPELGIARASAASRAGHDRPRVFVNRYELRIVFPRDTAHHSGWSAASQLRRARLS